MSRKAWIPGTFLTIGLFATAAELPDSKVHPVTGLIVTVDSESDGSDAEIRLITDPGQGQPESESFLTGNSVDDLAPRLEIAVGGDLWVVWWQDGSTDSVVARRLDFTTKSWSGERVLSDSGESSRAPEIVHHGSDAWVAFEFDDGSDTSVAVNIILDEPDPMGWRVVVGTTSFGGDLDTSIHATSGHLWVNWVDSDTHVAWSEYDSTTETWAVAQTESYASDTVSDARSRIRSAVLGP